ncbi:MAG: hypothetical protein DRH49_01825 [Candidatus Coatesbacteria bacterium]|nr:MAG: hypothetical protein DRH49_01825 [Candidatus Coatesbacteria bacterium]
MVMRIVVCKFSLLWVVISFSLAEGPLPSSVYLVSSSPSEVSSGVLSEWKETLDDSIVDLVIDDDVVWFATGNGLGRTDDNGKTFKGYFKEDGLSDDIITCVDGRSPVVICGIIDEDSVYPQWEGAGVDISDDYGITWSKLGSSQGLNGVEGKYQVAWDVVLYRDEIWVATWTKALFKSIDDVYSFTQILPEFSENMKQWLQESYEYHTYEIDIEGGEMWVACENGLAKTVDGGETWDFYSQLDGDGYRGRFTPTVHIMAENVVWAGTAGPYIDFYDQYHDVGEGVNLTMDGGETWENFNVNDGIGSNNINDITSMGDTVYLATSGGGVAYSGDFGNTWERATTLDGLPSMLVYCIDTDGDALWVGTEKGLARSTDGGKTWEAFDYTIEPGDSDSPRSIAYPNPFYPSSREVAYQRCNIQFSLGTSRYVTLKIYDFSGDEVRTLLDNEYIGPEDVVIVGWDGKDDEGRYVDNGVYFYILDIEGTPPDYGKIAVLQ